MSLARIAGPDALVGTNRRSFPRDDLGDEADRLQAFDHAVGEAGELDSEFAHHLDAAKLERVLELQDRPSIEHGREGVGGAERRRLTIDRLRDRSGRRFVEGDVARGAESDLSNGCCHLDILRDGQSKASLSTPNPSRAPPPSFHSSRIAAVTGPPTLKTSAPAAR
jgi:hypothetical protein